MQPSKQSIYNLLAMPRRYVVPLFQRPYVWRREVHWEPLWEDISAKCYEAVAAGQQKKGEVQYAHFLGAIVLNSVATYGSELDTRQIIDGQQRLITLQVMLIALKDIVASQDEAYFSPSVVGEGTRKQEFLETLNTVTRNGGVIGSEEEQYKVWPTNADRPLFLQIYHAGSWQTLEEAYPLQVVKGQALPRPSLVEAYLYFYDAIIRYLNGIDDQGNEIEAQSSHEHQASADVGFEGRLDALVKTLRQHVEVIMIDLEPRDNPQIIFETLNARGEPLYPSDLIRNFVFYQAGQLVNAAVKNGDEIPDVMSVDELYENYWWEYDMPGEGNVASFWKENERQGRVIRPRLDLFMSHFLTLKIGDEISVASLFQVFSDWWKTRAQNKEVISVQAELEELRRYSDAYRHIYEDGDSTKLGRLGARLRLMDSTTVFPVLLYLYVERLELTERQREQIMTDIESYVVRRLVCGLPAKNYNRIFNRMLLYVRGQNEPVGKSIRDYLLSLESPAGRWPTDTEFKEAWMKIPAYGRITPSGRIEMVLKAVDQQMNTKLQEQIQILSKLTVEHIWPRTPADGAWPELSEEEADIIHTFGNLTLLTESLNSKVSNGPFSAKRSQIAGQSKLRLNTYFQKLKDRDNWDIEQIKRRGMELFKLAKQVWPYP